MFLPSHDVSVVPASAFWQVARCRCQVARTTRCGQIGLARCMQGDSFQKWLWRRWGPLGFRAMQGGLIQDQICWLIGQWLEEAGRSRDCTAQLQLYIYIYLHLHVIVTSYLKAKKAKCGFPAGHCEILKRYLVHHLSPESCRALRHALYSTLCNLPSARSGSSCYGFSVKMYRGASCILRSTEPMQNLHLMLFVTTSLGLFILNNWQLDYWWPLYTYNFWSQTLYRHKVFCSESRHHCGDIGWVQSLLASPRGLWFQSGFGKSWKMNGNDEKLEMVGHV